jgi:hypothetical protein
LRTTFVYIAETKANDLATIVCFSDSLKVFILRTKVNDSARIVILSVSIVLSSEQTYRF